MDYQLLQINSETVLNKFISACCTSNDVFQTTPKKIVKISDEILDFLQYISTVPHVIVFNQIVAIIIVTIVIMSWFVDKAVMTEALNNGTLIDEESIEYVPEKLPDSIVDENVDVHLVRKYFTSDAWSLVEEAIKVKNEKLMWICNVCHHDLTPPSLVCDGCLLWYDFNYVKLSKQPKTRHWFCRNCS